MRAANVMIQKSRTEHFGSIDCRAISPMYDAPMPRSSTVNLIVKGGAAVLLQHASDIVRRWSHD